MNKFSNLVPHNWRQALKRRLMVVRDMTTRLQNLRRAGFVCTGAIDGGAYQGSWSVEFSDVFGQVPILLVEPQPASQSILTRLAEQHLDWEVAAVALSDALGEQFFRLGESNSGLVASQHDAQATIAVPCSTLEQLLSERSAFQPNLLKLDLQGHEIKALLGAGVELNRFEVIITEISILRIGEVPIFHEVDAFLEEHGYRLYDLLPQYDRPLDGALWQIDAFYVCKDSPLIASRVWGAS